MLGCYNVSPMAIKTYEGHCHCGAVRFKADTDLEKTITCNCSHCEIKGLILTFVPASQFTLLSGEDNLSEYRFNTKKIQHIFCKTCGVEPYGRGEDKAGNPIVAVNVRCLEGVDISKLAPTPLDGKSW